MAAPSPRLREKDVLEKCEYYLRIGYWNGTQKPRPGAWLGNFKGEERELAVYLLNSFQFLSENICTQMFEQTLVNLAQAVCNEKHSHPEARVCWTDFFRSVVVSHVPGEKPNPSDSGHHYVRLARQFLGIPESQIAEPSKALQYALEGRPVLFLDDFVGSGQQFIRLWKASLPINWSFKKCFEPMPNLRVYYCPLIATTYGRENIERECANAILRPLHVLDNTYNVLDPASGVWPDDIRSAGAGMIEAVAKRSNIKTVGFHNLTLALSFHNSTPDATLPLFFHEAPQWEHLVRRS